MNKEQNLVLPLSPVAKILKYDLKLVENFHERFCLKGKIRNKNDMEIIKFHHFAKYFISISIFFSYRQTHTKLRFQMVIFILNAIILLV